MTLPDTKVDLHSYHVVGLGRQVAVQQTGKVHHMGGSIECHYIALSGYSIV